MVSFHDNWTHRRGHSHDMHSWSGTACPITLCSSSQTSSYQLRGFLLASGYYACIGLKKIFSRQATAISLKAHRSRNTDFSTNKQSCGMMRVTFQSIMSAGSNSILGLKLNSVPVWKSLYCPLLVRKSSPLWLREMFLFLIMCLYQSDWEIVPEKRQQTVFKKSFFWQLSEWCQHFLNYCLI